MSLITEEELNQVEHNISNNPSLREILTGKFIESLLTIEDREKKHPMFSVLAHAGMCEKISNALIVLQQKCGRYKRIIRKMRNDPDYYNHHSTISEIIVLSHYYTKFRKEDIVYEPIICNTNNKCDVSIELNGELYFMEIFTVFEDEIEKNHLKMHRIVEKEINRLEQPYLISIGTELHFAETELNEFIEFIATLVGIDHDFNGDHKRFYYKRNGRNVADITLHRKRTSGKGYVAAYRSPVRSYDDAGRIKLKVMSKINQLPINGKNIVIIDLSYIFVDYMDVSDALYGENEEERNGIFENEYGERVSSVIAFNKHSYDTRKYFQNEKAIVPIENNIIEVL